MNNEPVAWIKKKEIGYMEVTKKCGAKDYATNLGLVPEDDDIPLYTHPAKELTDEDIAKVVYELNQKANTPERWVTAMEIGAETIIQLRDELRKAQEK